MPTPETIFQWKDLRANGAAIATGSLAGKELSLWRAEGTPSHGTAPGAFANPTNTTAGSLMQTDPAGGKQKWLTSLQFPGGYVGSTYTLWDRLLHMGGLSGTVTTAQNINGGSPATLTRHYKDTALVSDVGNQIWLEIATAVGVTGTTVTCAYANTAGASKTTQAVTFGGTGFREAERFIQLPLAAGDTGVQSVTSVTVLATTGTAGSFGIVVCQPILHMPNSACAPDAWQGATDGFIECLSGACWFWSSQQTAAAANAQIPALPGCMFSFVDK